jgi:hypothetical protein
MRVLESAIHIDSDNLNDFMNAATELCELLKQANIQSTPYLDGLPWFSKLSYENQKSIILNLNFYISLCKEQLNEGYKLTDNLSFTWRFLRKLDMTPKSDLFNLITDEDIIEVYSKDSRQLYRNLRFFDYSSYTIEELYSLEWWVLYERDEKVMNSLYDLAAKILDGQLNGHVYPDVGPHIVRELSSAEHLVHLYEARLLSPLSRNHQIEGVLAVLKITPFNN